MAALKVIALVGQADVGKSTVAKHLIINHGFILVKFSSVLKDMCRALGLSEDEIEGGLKEKPCSLLLGQTPRYAMQTLGTEWGRNLIHSDIWIRSWAHRTMYILSKGFDVVCDDCRFENEVKSVHKFPTSQVWRIFRKGLVPLDHASEQDWIKISPDETIKNYGSISDLKTAVDSILANYDPSH